VLAIYVGSLLFGGLLITASLFGGGDHGGDAHAGGDGHSGDGHDSNASYAWLSLFGLRFWSFGTAFFGLSGLVVEWLGGGGWHALAPALAGGIGAAAGLGASSVFRTLSREAVGQVQSAGALVGREGRLLLPVERAQRGKVRLALPAGGHVDLLAESGDDEVLDAGVDVLIVEVRGNIAVVTRAPAALPARPS
jgi:membrane protein implicated in regulation of membrane protease activity